MRRIFETLERVTRVVCMASLWSWNTGILQSTISEAMITLNRLGRWYLANASQTVPGILGGILGLWLARMFAIPSVRSMFDTAGIPMVIYYGIVVVAGILLGAGVIQSRPFEDD